MSHAQNSSLIPVPRSKAMRYASVSNQLLTSAQKPETLELNAPLQVLKPSGKIFLGEYYGSIRSTPEDVVVDDPAISNNHESNPNVSNSETEIHNSVRHQLQNTNEIENDSSDTHNEGGITSPVTEQANDVVGEDFVEGNHNEFGAARNESGDEEEFLANRRSESISSETDTVIDSWLLRRDNTERSVSNRARSRLPVGPVVVIGSRSNTPEERKSLTKLRILFSVLQALNVLITIGLYFMYHRMRSLIDFTIVESSGMVALQVVLSLLVALVGLIAVWNGKYTSLTIFYRVVVNVHFFAFVSRVPFFSYAFRYLLDFVGVYIALELMKRKSISVFTSYSNVSASHVEVDGVQGQGVANSLVAW